MTVGVDSIALLCDMRRALFLRLATWCDRAGGQDCDGSLEPGPYWVTAHPIKPHLGECCPTRPTDQRKDKTSLVSKGQLVEQQVHHAHSRTHPRSSRRTARCRRRRGGR